MKRSRRGARAQRAMRSDLRKPGVSDGQQTDKAGLTDEADCCLSRARYVETDAGTAAAASRWRDELTAQLGKLGLELAQVVPAVRPRARWCGEGAHSVALLRCVRAISSSMSLICRGDHWVGGVGGRWEGEGGR